MKKNLTYLILASFFLLFPFTKVDALTKISFDETANGSIKTTINFDEGFVGGIDLVLKLSDNVKYKSLDFNKDYLDKNFTKDVKYDATNHTIKIKVTAGGVGSSHNFLNSKRDLVLGNIKLETDEKKDVSYSINYQSLAYIDNGWSLHGINNNDLVLEGNNKFTYKVTTTENPSEGEDKPATPTEPENPPKEDDKEEEEKPSTGGSTSSGNTGGSTSGNEGSTEKPNTGTGNNQKPNSSTTTTTKPTTGSSNTTTSKPEDSKNDNNQTTDTNTDASDEVDTNDEENDDLENNDQSVTDNESSSKTETKKINKPLLIVISVVVIFIAISLVILLSMRGSKDKLDI